MILIDFSQFAISNILAPEFKQDLMKGCSKPAAVNLIRHAILSGLLYVRSQYGSKFGEIVLACDGRNNWRKGIFPHYKASRKKSRESSDLDWDLILDTISLIRDEIDAFLPYSVVCVDEAEGDDVIAVLAKWCEEHPVSQGLLEGSEPVLILSSDQDFLQLQKYPNVRQYSLIQKKWMPCDDPAKRLREHIAGAGDDGIPNVLSDPATFVTEGIRQKPMRAPRLAEFAEKGRDACEDDFQRERWDLNTTLIDFDCIPSEVQGAIIDKYSTGSNKDRKKLFAYLTQKGCNRLLERIGEF